MHAGERGISCRLHLPLSHPLPPPNPTPPVYSCVLYTCFSHSQQYHRLMSLTQSLIAECLIIKALALQEPRPLTCSHVYEPSVPDFSDTRLACTDIHRRALSVLNVVNGVQVAPVASCSVVSHTPLASVKVICVRQEGISISRVPRKAPFDMKSCH
jgi:hypothetical protein